MQSAYPRLFGTPVSLHYFGETVSQLNRSIVNDILEEQKKDPKGIVRSNFGGWHSQNSLEEKYSSFQSIKQLIDKQVRLYTANHGFMDSVTLEGGPSNERAVLQTYQLWANVSSPGDINNPHTHGIDCIAGVYYPADYLIDGKLITSYDDDKLPLGDNIANGDLDDPGGSLALLDPSYGKRIGLVPYPQTQNCSWYHLYPKAGLLVLFPGYLIHMVTPFKENKTRMSISFSVRYL